MRPHGVLADEPPQECRAPFVELPSQIGEVLTRLDDRGECPGGVLDAAVLGEIRAETPEFFLRHLACDLRDGFLQPPLGASAGGGQEIEQVGEHLRASRHELILHEGRGVRILVCEERQNRIALRKHGAR